MFQPLNPLFGWVMGFFTLVPSFVQNNPTILKPEQVVQHNLDQYNQRNIEGFMAWIDQDIQVINFQDQKITLAGKEACKKFYQDLFVQSPQLHSTLMSRMVLGNKVIDHERIVGRMGAKEPVELVLIYEVQSNKITKINVIKP